MKRNIFLILAGIILYLFFPGEVLGIHNPLEAENNKVGVHILDPIELEQAAELVNSSGGDWGYVTIPLRTDDRNRIKWQKFMDKCKKLHLIPIVRLATTMQPSFWEKPDLYDTLDSANFLNDLDWPVENRYVVVYNEPNHIHEWGGEVKPEEYAFILKYSSKILKNTNEDFYVLPAGIDAAAPNGNTTMSFNRFVSRMFNKHPDVFENIDAWNSHSYPNPGFSGSPLDTHLASIKGYQKELKFVGRYVDKDLPVFITETGWKEGIFLDQNIVADYYKTAFENVWNDKKIAAVTPFILKADNSVFSDFALIENGSQKKPAFLAIQELEKIAGKPKLDNIQIADKIDKNVLGRDSVKQPKFKEFYEEKIKEKINNYFKQIWYTQNKEVNKND